MSKEQIKDILTESQVTYPSIRQAHITTNNITKRKIIMHRNIKITLIKLLYNIYYYNNIYYIIINM